MKDKAYAYVAPKGTITGVTPKEGSAAGGYRVTIKGDKFAGTITVSFGETLAPDAKVVDATTIEIDFASAWATLQGEKTYTYDVEVTDASGVVHSKQRAPFPVVADVG